MITPVFRVTQIQDFIIIEITAKYSKVHVLSDHIFYFIIMEK